MSNTDRRLEGGALPGGALGKGLLIVFAVVTIPACIGVYVSAKEFAQGRATGVTAVSRDANASGASAIRLDAVVGITTSVVLLTLAFAIDSYPLPALLAATSIYLGRFAAFMLVLPWMPWRWPSLFGLTIVAVMLTGCVIRALLARRSEVADEAAAPSAMLARAGCAYWVAYLLALATPVASLTIITASSPRPPRDPADFLALSAINMAILAVVVLLTMIVTRLPRPQLSTQASRRAWTLAPLFVCLLLGVALAYHHWLSQLLPNLVDRIAMRDHAHLLLGWIVVGCAVPAMLEEWLFRRLAMAALGSLMSVPMAIIVSSTIFASAHALAPLNTPILFVLGIILGWSYATSGRLLLPILLHFGFNLALLTISMA